MMIYLIMYIFLYVIPYRSYTTCRSDILYNDKRNILCFDKASGFCNLK